MKTLSQTSNSQWENYQQLELIPSRIPNPDGKASTFKFGLDFAWRVLISLLVDELVDREQQVEYIERCWANKEFEQPDNSTSSLQKLWLLMN
ncbi:hypothetical protein [Scytonema millei]|uniref:Uncharacterized protein n=1 Tax=Scytonema millei VB511283 TaxID=1245923 RepID=A0A9X5I4N5_9CYAN|nr:hypothetical protein [Scytonema millei]NHC35788.1 hypothetical protein [Scytonema millei VB511283]